MALREALFPLGLPCPSSTVAAYQRINRDLWAAFRHGEIGQSALARERFRRLLREIGGDPQAGLPPGRPTASPRARS